LLLLYLDRWIVNGGTNFAFYIIFIYSNSPPTIYSNDIHLCAYIKRSTIYVCLCLCVCNGILSISMMIITRFAYNISDSSLSAAAMWCGALCMQHTKSALRRDGFNWNFIFSTFGSSWNRSAGVKNNNYIYVYINIYLGMCVYILLYTRAATYSGVKTPRK